MNNDFIKSIKHLNLFSIYSLPGHDCNFSSLSKIKDNIYVNIFDEMIIEKHEVK